MSKHRTMRNPIGHVGSYQEYFASMADGERRWDAEFADLPPVNQAAMTWSRLNDGKKFLLHQYGAGFDLEFIATTLRERMPRMLADGEYVRIHRKHPQWSDYHLSGNSRVDVGFVALALSLVTDNEILLQLRQCISVLRTQRRYLFDLLLHAYDPVQQVIHDYQKDNYTARWADPILRILAMPVEKRATAMAAHMQAWPRIVNPFGYKEKLNSPPWFYAHSCELAYEVALAVCAYDIDDAPFRDHPYYPRDLADYYRQHIRHSRDQWRPLYVGADLPITVPPPPKKADLAKSKRKGIARWVELVADGNIEATEAVLDATGKPRKIYDLQTLLQNLTENDIVIYADLKDDDTLEQQSSDLSEARALGAFDGPPGPPYGPARCSATLTAWSTWLAERGYQLVDINDGDSDWHAVVVNTKFYPELQQLSEQLGIPVRRYGADLHLSQE